MLDRGDATAEPLEASATASAGNRSVILMLNVVEESILDRGGRGTAMASGVDSSRFSSTVRGTQGKGGQTRKMEEARESEKVERYANHGALRGIGGVWLVAAPQPISGRRLSWRRHLFVWFV